MGKTLKVSETFRVFFVTLLVFLPESLYNQFRMNAATLRLLLTVTLVAMYLLAMLFLRRRGLGLGAYLAWGLLALSVPALGPFLVIIAKPGSSRSNHR
jgi:hypothetical protein